MDLSILIKTKIPIPTSIAEPKIHHKKLVLVVDSSSVSSIEGVATGMIVGEGVGVVSSSTSANTLPVVVGDGLIVALGVGVGFAGEVNVSVALQSLAVNRSSLSLHVTLYVPALVYV